MVYLKITICGDFNYCNLHNKFPKNSLYCKAALMHHIYYLISFGLSSDRLLRVKTSEVPNRHKKIQKENYYAVYYTERWYIGRVININEDQKTCMVKFLKENLNEFIWPSHSDMAEVELQYLFHGPLNMQGTCPMRILESERDLVIKKYKVFRSAP